MDKTRLKKPTPIDIPIHQDLRAVLLAVPVESREGFVVPECAAAYDNGTLTYKIKNILENCGISTSRKDENGKTICVKSFHSLRSACATEMANAGVPLTDICTMLNHSSVETTEGYLRKDQNRLSHCVEVLPSMLGATITQKTSITVDEEVADLLKSKLLQGESISEGLKRIIGLSEKRNEESSIVEYTPVETPPVKTTLAPTFISENQTVEYPLAPIALTENPLKVVA